ncbi:hypothetical protein TcYC6_0004480 [Trypanosoma cruzi]|nr:hypothetical protein TcYC6_0004480 [Trypanosoma cruzi]
MIFIIILSKPQGAPRTRSAPPQEERAIPLQQLTCRTEPGAEQKPVEPGHLGEAHASMGARRAARFSSFLLRQSARGAHGDSGDRRAIGGGGGDWSRTPRLQKRLMVIPFFGLWRRKPPPHELRWIAWPRDKNRDDPCEANAPLSPHFPLLPPVGAEVRFPPGSQGVLHSLFAAGTRHLFRCRVEDGALAGPARLPMGHNAGQKFSGSLLARHSRATPVVHSLWAAPPLVCVGVWVDNARIAGSKGGATLWEAQVLRDAAGRHATMGRTANRALRRTPFWGAV